MGETVGETRSFLMGEAILSNSLIQFSVDGHVCVPSLLFDLTPNSGGGNEDTGDLLQKVPYMHCCTQCPDPVATADPSLCQGLLGTHGQVWVSLLWGHCSFLLGPGPLKVCLCPPRVCFPSPV